MTGVTLTITPTASTVVQALITGRTYRTAGTGNINISLLIDGVTIQTYDVNAEATASGQGFALSGQATLSAGSRVIKMQMFTFSGTGVVDDANLSIQYLEL